MADTKISALTAGAPALSTDELPVARSGANRKLLISDIATFIGTNNVLSQTVAQVQANNGTYTEGTWIIVSDNIGGLGGSSGTIFPVGSGGYIQSRGWCRTYLSGAMDDPAAVFIDWEPTTDFVSCIEEPWRGNKVTAFYNTAGLTGFPFDSTSIKQCTLIDPVACNINLLSVVYAATFEGYNTITMDAGCTFSGKAGREATITLVGTSVFTGEVGANGGVTLFGTQNLTWCKVGVNKNVGCSGISSTYTQTGAVIDGPNSTFEITSADSASVNPDASNTIDMATFPFAGIIVCDDGTHHLATFSNFPSSHTFKITPLVGITVDFINNAGAGTNIYINTVISAASSLLISAGDFMEFNIKSDDANTLVVSNVFKQ